MTLEGDSLDKCNYAGNKGAANYSSSLPPSLQRRSSTSHRVSLFVTSLLASKRGKWPSQDRTSEQRDQHCTGSVSMLRD